MDTAAGVEIGGVRTEAGTVCVAGDQDVPGLLGIVGQALFHPVLVGVVFGGAGGVKHSEMFQGLPEIPNQKAGQPPEGGVQGICLMSVGQVEALSLTALLQDNALIKGKSREEGLAALGIRAKIGVTDLVGITRSFFLHIMIAVQQIKPSLAVKQGEEPEHIIVNLNDLTHAPVFPQLIPVSQFNIGVALGIVVLQCRKIEVLVFQKIIAPGAVPPMTVAEQNITAAGAQRKNGGILKSVGQAGGVTHIWITPFLFRVPHIPCMRTIPVLKIMPQGVLIMSSAHSGNMLIKI